MPNETIVGALEQEDALCDTALIGLFDWLADESRIALRHPLTACCSIILRHIDTEENIIFGRLLARAPEHANLIASLQVDHLQIRDQLHDIEDLVMSEQRGEARTALTRLRELMARHTSRERALVGAIAECMTDPNEVGHLFHSGYFRGKFDPFRST